MQKKSKRGARKKNVPEPEHSFLCLNLICVESYASEIAPTGHCAAHAPQSIQASALISYLPSPSEIALTGHSASQLPHQIQSSPITCDMGNYLLFNKYVE